MASRSTFWFPGATPARVHKPWPEPQCQCAHAPGAITTCASEDSGPDAGAWPTAREARRTPAMLPPPNEDGMRHAAPPWSPEKVAGPSRRMSMPRGGRRNREGDPTQSMPLTRPSRKGMLAKAGPPKRENEHGLAAQGAEPDGARLGVAILKRYNRAESCKHWRRVAIRGHVLISHGSGAINCPARRLRNGTAALASLMRRLPQPGESRHAPNAMLES